MHFFDATHTSINAVDKAEAESSSPHSIIPKTPVRSVGLGHARAKRGNSRPSMKNNSQHATRQALRFSCRKHARDVLTSAPDVASKRAQTTSEPVDASKRAQTTSVPNVANKSAQTTSAPTAHSASATDADAAAELGSKRLKASLLADADSRPAEANACADAANDSSQAEANACADAANDSSQAEANACADAANDSTPAEGSACADAADDSRPAEANACADAANDSTPAEGSACADAADDSRPAEGSACADAADDSRPAEANACADAANDSTPAEGSACTGSGNDSTAALMADADSNQAQTVAMPSAADAQCNTEAAACCMPETEGSSGVVSSTDVVHSVPDARVCLKQLLLEYQLAAEARNGADKITIVPADTCSQATRQHQVHTELQPDFTSVLCEQQSLPDGIRHARVV